MTAECGTIFDSKEFALNDGAGIRTTVFFKGCPLRCIWCHNPEGLSPQPELFINHNGCLSCKLCRRPCTHPDCKPFDRCLHICPKNLVKRVGDVWDADALADKLLAKTGIFRETGGGITLSGGEPLMQAAFAKALLLRLRGHVHTAIETSGYAEEADFQAVAGLCDFVYMDIKLMDSALHRKYTGVPNEKILKNALWLQKSGIPHCFRTPLIPGITDTAENLAAIRRFLADEPWETLPYNTLAGAKYASVGRKFQLS